MMCIITIPDQSPVAKACQGFDADGRMKPSSYHDRVVDVCEQLVKFIMLTRDMSDYLRRLVAGSARYPDRHCAVRARRTDLRGRLRP